MNKKIVEGDLDGKFIGAAKPELSAPIEVFIHAAIYKARPEGQFDRSFHPALVALHHLRQAAATNQTKTLSLLQLGLIIDGHSEAAPVTPGGSKNSANTEGMDPCRHLC